MNPFLKAFADEVEKLGALNPKSTAWAMSRGLTTGIASGLMGAAMMSMSNRGRPKHERRSVLAPALTSASLGIMTGLGKGYAEKGLERTFMKALSKAKFK